MSNFLPVPGGSSGKATRWMVFVSLVIVLSNLRFRVRHPSELWEEGGFDSQVMLKVALWMLLTAIAAWFVVKRRTDFRLLKSGPLRWYMVYALLAMLSSLYSVSASLSAFSALQLIVAVMLVISMRESLVDFHIFAILYVAFNWVLVSMAFSGLHFGIPWIAESTQYDVEMGHRVYRFSSAIGHPMAIGFVAATAAIWLIIRMPRRGWIGHSLLVGWMILTVVLTISRTAAAGLAAGLIVIALGRRSIAVVALLAGSAGLLVPVFSDSMAEKTMMFLSRGQSTEELATLSRRTYIYQEVLNRGTEHFFLGEGFRSSRRVDLSDAVGLIVHAHNAFLEAFLGMGILGLLSMMAVVAALCLRLGRLVFRGPVAMPWGPFSGLDAIGLCMPLFAFLILTVGIAGTAGPVVIVCLCVMALVDSAASGYFDFDADHSVEVDSGTKVGINRTA